MGEARRTQKRVPKMVQARRSLRTSILFALAAATVVIAAWGWWPLLTQTGTFAVGEWLARILKSFAPDPALFDPKQAGNAFTRIAAMLGMTTSFFSVVLLVRSTVGKALSATYARWFRRGHTIILGDSALASNLAEGLNRRGQSVVQLVIADHGIDAHKRWHLAMDAMDRVMQPGIIDGRE